MEIKELEAFYVTARAGGVTRAAEILNESQSTLSKRLRNLEQEIGEPLFNRDTRPLSLTPLGERFIASMAPLIRSMQELQAIVAGETTREHVDLKASSPLAERILPRAIQQCYAKDPTGVFRIFFDRPELVAEAVENGEADFGLVHAPVLSPGIKITQIAEYDRVLVAPKGHAILNEETPEISSIAEWPIILGSAGTYSRAIIERVFRENELKLNVRVEVDNNSAMKRFVSLGFGLAIIPRISLDESEYGTLGVLSLAHLFPVAGIRLLQAGSTTLSNASEELISQVTHVAKIAEAEIGSNRVA